MSRSTRETFIGLLEQAPAPLRPRFWDLLESVVFRDELDTQVDTLEAAIAALDTRVEALESAP